MAEEVCVCPQCGKKYRLKEGFEAKSFSCKSCGATVWVGGKAPTPAPTSRRPAAAGPVSKRGGRVAAASGAGKHAGRAGRAGHAGRRSHGREAAEQEESGGRRGRGPAKPKSNKNILIAVGAVAVIAIVVIIALSSGKKGKAAPAVAENPAATTGTPGLAAAGSEGATPTPAATNPMPENPPVVSTPAKPVAKEQPKAPGGEEEAQQPEGEEPAAKSPEGGETPTKLGGDGKKKNGPGVNDPPATLGHLESTPPELRKQIDELIAVLLDPNAGREVHEAKEQLAAIGKPAFLPILGGMAKIRDTLADDDSIEERRIESSLMLADQCLREMDGYLDAHEKQPIRPGTDKKYLSYILALHYRRWKDGIGSTPLKDMPEMPGPFDPTKSPKQPGDDEGEEGK